jgi:hypothetical protein
MTDVKIEQRSVNKINKIIETGKPGVVVIKGVKVRIDPQQKVANDIPIADEKTGGILPLVALIPLIAKAVAAAGVLTGGVATAAKVGHDMARGNGLTDLETNLPDRKPPCTAKVIDAILTLEKAGFSIMRM